MAGNNLRHVPVRGASIEERKSRLLLSQHSWHPTTIDVESLLCLDSAPKPLQFLMHILCFFDENTPIPEDIAKCYIERFCIPWSDEYNAWWSTLIKKTMHVSEGGIRIMQHVKEELLKKLPNSDSLPRTREFVFEAAQFLVCYTYKLDDCPSDLTIHLLHHFVSIFTHLLQHKLLSKSLTQIELMTQYDQTFIGSPMFIPALLSDTLGSTKMSRNPEQPADQLLSYFLDFGNKVYESTLEEDSQRISYRIQDYAKEHPDIKLRLVMQLTIHSLSIITNIFLESKIVRAALEEDGSDNLTLAPYFNEHVLIGKLRAKIQNGDIKDIDVSSDLQDICYTEHQEQALSIFLKTENDKSDILHNIEWLDNAPRPLWLLAHIFLFFDGDSMFPKDITKYYIKRFGDTWSDDYDAWWREISREMLHTDGNNYQIMSWPQRYLLKNLSEKTKQELVFEAAQFLVWYAVDNFLEASAPHDRFTMIIPHFVAIFQHLQEVNLLHKFLIQFELIRDHGGQYIQSPFLIPSLITDKWARIYEGNIITDLVDTIISYWYTFATNTHKMQTKQLEHAIKRFFNNVVASPNLVKVIDIPPRSLKVIFEVLLDFDFLLPQLEHCLITTATTLFPESHGEYEHLMGLVRMRQAALYPDDGSIHSINIQQHEDALTKFLSKPGIKNLDDYFCYLTYYTQTNCRKPIYEWPLDRLVNEYRAFAKQFIVFDTPHTSRQRLISGSDSVGDPSSSERNETTALDTNEANENDQDDCNTDSNASMCKKNDLSMTDKNETTLALDVIDENDEKTSGYKKNDLVAAVVKVHKLLLDNNVTGLSGAITDNMSCHSSLVSSRVFFFFTEFQECLQAYKDAVGILSRDPATRENKMLANSFYHLARTITFWRRPDLKGKEYFSGNPDNRCGMTDANKKKLMKLEYQCLTTAQRIHRTEYYRRSLICRRIDELKEAMKDVDIEVPMVGPTLKSFQWDREERKFEKIVDEFAEILLPREEAVRSYHSTQSSEVWPKINIHNDEHVFLSCMNSES